MRRIFTIGETVLDIIFKDHQPVSATPGGSMLNTSISLGRLGLDVFFISEHGNDHVGELADHFLHANGVRTDYMYRYDGYPSSLALAFLDKDNNADYNFYKKYPEKRMDIRFPELTDDDIVLFGSFYGIDPAVHRQLSPFLNEAKNKNALIIYDPNFRISHLQKIDTYRPVIMENLAVADMIKGSDEDFAHIFNTRSVKDTWHLIRNADGILVHTANKNPVTLCMSDRSFESYEVPVISPVSTIGAGDSFNAGLIYGLIALNIRKTNLKNMDINQGKSLIDYAIKFSSHVCMSYDNYLSKDFADKIRKEDRMNHQIDG